jgi:hypothetical protein
VEEIVKENVIEDVSIGSLVKVQLRYTDGYYFSNDTIAIGIVMNIFAEYDDVIYARVLINGILCGASFKLDDVL